MTAQVRSGLRGKGTGRCYDSRMDLSKTLPLLCQRYGVDSLYAFGSRAGEVAACVRGEGRLHQSRESDVDLGALPTHGRRWTAQECVQLTLALEDLLDVGRVDLVVLTEAEPYLALDVVAGELLFCADALGQAEYELYVLRRAGDLAYFERERRRQILGGVST